MSLKCVLNRNHLVFENPVVLKCANEEHCPKACSNCILKQCDYSGNFKCSLCHNIHKMDSLEKFDFKIQSVEKDVFKQNMKNVLINGKKIQSELKGKLLAKNFKRLFGNIFEFIEQDLVIRLESLNFEFDDLEKKLYKKIDEYRSNELEKNKIDINSLKSLHLKNKNISSHILIEKCKLYEENFKILNEIINLKFSKLKSSLKDKKHVGSYLPNKSMFGFVSGSFSIITIAKCIDLKPTITLVDLGCFIKSACGLAEIYNGKKICLALTDYASNDIKIMQKYDSYCLKEIDILSIDRFRMNKFKTYYAICSSYDLNSLTGLEDKSDSIYACDMELDRILIFDQKLTKIKKIIVGVPNNDGILEEFMCLRDICYYDNFVYVLDQGKFVVNILYKNGDFYRNFYFNDLLSDNLIQSPWSVRVGSNRIFIIDWKRGIFVFDFNFKLKNYIQLDGVYSMCLVNDFERDNIYLFLHSEYGQFCGYKISTKDHTNHSILVYENFFNNLKYRSEFMIFSSTQKFILSLGWTKSLALIDFF